MPPQQNRCQPSAAEPFLRTSSFCRLGRRKRNEACNACDLLKIKVAGLFTAELHPPEFTLHATSRTGIPLSLRLQLHSARGHNAARPGCSLIPYAYGQSIVFHMQMKILLFPRRFGISLANGHSLASTLNQDPARSLFIQSYTDESHKSPHG